MPAHRVLATLLRREVCVTVLAWLWIIGAATAQMWGGKKSEETALPAAEVSTASVPGEDIPLFPSGLPVDISQVPSGLANITAQGCNACHGAVHDAWAGSAHARAGRSPVFQEALKRAGQSTACVQCHRPVTAQHPQLAAGYIEGDLSRPNLKPNDAFDATLMAEGVGCAACHVRDGKIVSTRAVADAPHPVAYSGELGSSEMCSTCHQLSYPGSKQAFYNTYGEWKATPHAAAGMQCQDCHMPTVATPSMASGFAGQADHSFTPKLPRALTVLVDLKDDQVHRGTPLEVGVRIQNTGAAHHVPTGSPYKTLSFTVELQTAEGVVLASSAPEILSRQTSPDAPYDTISDNRIPAGGEHAFSVSLLVAHKARAGRAQLVVNAKTSQEPVQVLQSIPLELN